MPVSRYSIPPQAPFTVSPPSSSPSSYSTRTKPQPQLGTYCIPASMLPSSSPIRPHNSSLLCSFLPSFLPSFPLPIRHSTPIMHNSIIPFPFPIPHSPRQPASKKTDCITMVSGKLLGRSTYDGAEQDLELSPLPKLQTVTVQDRDHPSRPDHPPRLILNYPS